MKHVAIGCALLALSGLAHAAKDPVSVGNGIYMLTDQNFTIFGSADGIVAKLMTQANKYCAKKNGGEAEMVDSAGTDAVPGGRTGQVQRWAQGASGTVHFRCSGDRVAPAVSAPVSGGRYMQVREYGDITSQLSLPDPEACSAMLRPGAPFQCASTSAASTLLYRAVLEDPSTKDVLVVDSMGPVNCDQFVRGLVDGGSLGVLQACKAK